MRGISKRCGRFVGGRSFGREFISVSLFWFCGRTRDFERNENIARFWDIIPSLLNFLGVWRWTVSIAPFVMICRNSL